MKYRVTVGAFGALYDGDSLPEATRQFEMYVRYAREGISFAVGENIELIEDGKLLRAYYQTQNKD